jgi:predicted Zn-dependent protease
MPMELSEGIYVKVLRPGDRRIIGLCLVGLLPLTLFGRTGKRSLPDGVCGSPQSMRQASLTGQSMVQQVFYRGIPWGDNTLSEYVNRLGQNLAHSSGSQQVFSSYVLYNPKINAQAFPGGHIVINSGVISLAESEAELASVLSHEIAHENACDWRAGPARGNLFELIALVPTVVFGGPAGIAIAAGGGWAATLAHARSSRSAEQRADSLAAQYLVRGGYDPHSAEEFFRRLQSEQERMGEEPVGLLATHPRTLDREKQLEKFIPSLPPPEFAVHDDTEFLQVRRAVREYDEMYSRLVGVHVPGQDLPRPELSRRPPIKNLR